MKRAIVYGAGKIGRGFIGRKLSESGYEVCFLDILKDLVSALNAAGRYTVRFVSNEGERDVSVGPVRAIDSLTEEAVRAIAECDLLATAVGVNNLPDIAPIIARGIMLRRERGGGPLDAILCENQIGADGMMRGWINGCLDGGQQAWAEKNLGLVEASIECMVPPQLPAADGDGLLIRAEYYAELPVDRAGFRGALPEIEGLKPYSPFDFFIQRKLFLQNGGHALCAYMGYLRGYEAIWQAMEDPEIAAAAEAYMRVSAEALVSRYGEAMRPHVARLIPDLLRRYRNRGLMDTVARVGADPVRKLRRNDRMVGAALLALEQRIDPSPIVRGIAAALRFDRAGDVSAPGLQAALREEGVDSVLRRFLSLRPEEPLYGMVKRAYLDGANTPSKRDEEKNEER